MSNPLYIVFAQEAQRPPATKESIMSDVASGTLSFDDLFWNESTNAWLPLKELFSQSRATPPPLPTQFLQTEAHRSFFPKSGEWTRDAFTESEKKGWREFLCAAHPLAWRRLWAKCIDIGLARVALEVIAAIGQAATGTNIPYEEYPLISGFITFVVWGGLTVFLEGLSTSVFGITLGKKILDLSVLKEDHAVFTGRLAYKRAHLCMLYGLWYLLVFPIGPLAASYRAYKELVKTGATAWDRQLALCVKGRLLHPIRLFLGAFLGLGLIFSTTYLHDSGKKEIKRNFERNFDKGIIR